MLRSDVDVFFITSVKRENKKIVGVSAIQSRAIPPVRLYMDLSHIYYTQFTGRQSVFLVPYIANEDPLEISAFRLAVKKEEEVFTIELPKNIEQRQGLASLLEYVRMPTDFI